MFCLRVLVLDSLLIIGSTLFLSISSYTWLICIGFVVVVVETSSMLGFIGKWGLRPVSLCSLCSNGFYSIILVH